MKPSPAVRKCEACYSVGDPFIGHTVRNCPNISSNDKAGMLKTFSLDIDEELNQSTDQLIDNYYSECDDHTKISTSRVNIEPSPQFNVKIQDIIITMIMDTGATGSMISVNLCEQIGLKIHPSPHSAIQADGDKG